MNRLVQEQTYWVVPQPCKVLSFFLFWGDTCSLRMPALWPALQAGPMRPVVLRWISLKTIRSFLPLPSMTMLTQFDHRDCSTSLSPFLRKKCNLRSKRHLCFLSFKEWPVVRPELSNPMKDSNATLGPVQRLEQFCPYFAENDQKQSLSDGSTPIRKLLTVVNWELNKVYI